MNSMAPLTIREAGYDELQQMTLLHMLSVHERVGKKPAADFHPHSSIISYNREAYETSYFIPGFNFYVAEADEFQSEYPIIGAQDKPLLGLLMTCPGNYGISQTRFSHLYTVKSSYKTGAIFLHYGIGKALQEKRTSICATAVYDASRNFALNRAHFSAQSVSGDLILKDIDFPRALETLETYINQPYASQVSAPS